MITDYYNHFINGSHRGRMCKIMCENVIEVGKSLTHGAFFRNYGTSMTMPTVKSSGSTKSTAPGGTSLATGGLATTPPTSKGPSTTAPTAPATASAPPLHRP